MQHNKIEAIYAVREAAERKAVLEAGLIAHPTPDARDALLAAQLTLEARTQDAIDACHHCGRVHADDEPHPESRDNVIEVDFGRSDESG